MSNPPPINEYAPIPVAHALILDPWLEPLPSPGPAPYPSQYSGLNPELTTSFTDSSSDAILQEKNSDLSRLPRMLVLNSDPFTLWQEHFARLKEVVEAWEPEGRRVLTLGEWFDHIDRITLSSIQIQCGPSMYHSQTSLCFPFYEGQALKS